MDCACGYLEFNFINFEYKMSIFKCKSITALNVSLYRQWSLFYLFLSFEVHVIWNI